jgi:hypothetical protein
LKSWVCSIQSHLQGIISILLVTPLFRLICRARMDEANLEPEASCSLASSAAEAARAEAEAAAAASAAAQEQLFWMEAPLLLVELLWGLLRCAAALPIAAPAAAPQGQLSNQSELLSRVQALLEGPHGLYEAVLGVQCLAVTPDADSVHEFGSPVQHLDAADETGEAQEPKPANEAPCSVDVGNEVPVSVADEEI